jgi:hypothetical protein
MTQHDGVSISGGNVTIGALAQGAQARAVSHGDISVTAGSPELASALAALLEVLREHQHELPQPVLAAGPELAAELAEQEPEAPSRGKVKELLARITEGAGSVTALTAAVEAVRHALN